MNLIIIFAAKYLFLVSIILGGIFFYRLEATRKKKFIVFSLASFALSFIVAKLLGAIFNNPRPFVSDHITPLIAHAANNGFPSDHTLLTMAIAAVVFMYNRKLGAVLAVISLFVGSARVVASIHHQADILGAIGIAILSVIVVTSRVA
jgi:undecaprenyl-diphosphatase